MANFRIFCRYSVVLVTVCGMIIFPPLICGWDTLNTNFTGFQVTSSPMHVWFLLRCCFYQLYPPFILSTSDLPYTIDVFIFLIFVLIEHSEYVHELLIYELSPRCNIDFLSEIDSKHIRFRFGSPRLAMGGEIDSKDETDITRNLLPVGTELSCSSFVKIGPGVPCSVLSQHIHAYTLCLNS